jgi:putative membrane protein
MGPMVLACGVLLLAVLWIGPLPEMARSSFTAHMTLHMGVVAVAAPLMAVGLAGGPMDPARAYPRLFSALPAAALELAVVWAWHAPALHHAARESAGWLVLEQGSFLAAGLLVWMSALGGERSHPGNRAGSGVVALLLTSMHMTLLGGLLALAPRPLYQHGAEAMSRAAVLDDQHAGGTIMLLVGGAVYLIGGLGLSRRLLVTPSRRRLA